MSNLETHGAMLPFHKEYGETVGYQGDVATEAGVQTASVYVPKGWLKKERPARIQVILVLDDLAAG